ncbi:zonular occludens toxin family protein [Spongiibacter marinus]|uniref:zonular occludens toxin family protein n=1 Tax=Spongiibacter marinus TaxID=354246 RepID=UPI0035615C84
MIVFHEGLPGSGKSYEACAMHILPAIEKGRRVVTNIEGINHEKFAELSGVPLPYVIEKLQCIYTPDVDEQRQAFLEHSGKDALIVLDEVQNLFPSERQKLSDEWNRYITEHRHDGLDIVLMGQDRRDCHSMWRRRIQRVITFNKLSAVGMDNRYRWVVLEATRPEKYKETTSGTRTYDSKYFGLYKSHTDGTDNKSVYSDKRATVFAGKGLRYGVPAFVVALFFAFSTLSDFFTPKDDVVSDKPQIAQQPPQRPTIAPNKPASKPKPEPKAEQKPEPPPALDIFDEYARKHRLRLSAVLVGEDKPDKFYAQVDILNSSYHRQEVFTAQGLRDMGWQLSYRESGLYIKKGNTVHIARPWPIDKYGKVDNHTMAQL